MKQALIALIALFMLASCEPKNDEAVTEGTPTAMMDKTGDEGNECPQVPNIEPILVRETQANRIIQRYHKHLYDQANRNSSPDDSISFDSLRNNLSFMIDANILRDYLDMNPDFSMLDVYLAMNDDSLMTLVYIGAKNGEMGGPNGDSVLNYVEVPYEITDSSSKFMLDRAFPCPTCPRVSLHGISEN